ncbi:UDP-N-acetylglucosamine 2-epimerase [Psychroserpens sp. AS72]|uniref:UDP-N-acetylglucosamine 2-epimerase n=1 Tax=Psychroserpens sp. AS72 TaxID=3135775 RepID=UPI003170947F
MKIKIGFFTGARSDYGVTKKLIKKLVNDNDFEVKIFVSGMHLLDTYGNTYTEILDDGLTIYKKIHTYSEIAKDKRNEFSETLNKVYDVVKNENLDAGYIVGDRIEAYGVALALHFSNIPILHYAGGQITKGAVDNIYRYNISNLSYLHFTTIKTAFERLKKLPVINPENVFFTGSTAIDSIYEFLEKPLDINSLISELNYGNFVLMTFHGVTNADDKIASVMDYAISKILKLGLKVLITYPNNDDGVDEIMEVIETYRNNSNVIIRKNLGARGYYSAVYNSKFVIGNSSSGVIEVPYFNKISINIGHRQEGRDTDTNVWNVNSNPESIDAILDKGMSVDWVSPKIEGLYGNGKSNEAIAQIIKKRFRNCDS